MGTILGGESYVCCGGHRTVEKTSLFSAKRLLKGLVAMVFAGIIFGIALWALCLH